MVLHQGKGRHLIRALLDTGFLIALINKQTVEKLGIEQCKNQWPRVIETYTGKILSAAGQFYTEPLRLQHRRHYSWEKFEISPMDPEIDVFLPFSWISNHPPQGAWTDKEIWFNSPGCLESCTKNETDPFSLSWDNSVAHDPTAHVIGHASGVSEADPLDKVPMEFHQYLGIMKTEAVDALPVHRPYDCKIDLQEGSMPPWGPIYPLSEEELQVLRDWLKEMERT